MKLVHLSTLLLILLSSCKISSPKTVEQTENERKSDSLRVVADSLAIMRNMHAMRTGVHLHNNADLAAVAHQDPKKTNRIKKVQREKKQERINAEKNRSEAIRKALEKRKENGN